MPFIGEVNIDIYFGTKYDMINVPFDPGAQIPADATKIISMTGQVVWQSTWLTEIQIDIEDYQEIVGAQYVRMVENMESENYGAHWYEVVGYNQLSKKCVRLGLAYDPLLTLGFANISGCSGILKRHSVANDTHWLYTFSSEPIDQIAPYDYSYATIDNGVNVGMSYPLVGFPVDMDTTPEVIEYDYAPEGATIYMPYLEKAPINTHFSSSLGSGSMGTGLAFYYWMGSETVRDNYAYAVGLGYDLVSESYYLPGTSRVELTYSDGAALSVVTGTSQLFNSGFSLYDGSYNNAKASEIGMYFTLYNEFTGDSVTVNNYDLTNTQVRTHIDPSPTGCFMARFSGYMYDTTGFSGLVKSPGYPSFTLTSDLGYNSQTNILSNAIGQSILSVYETNTSASLSTALTNARNTAQGTEESAAIANLANMGSVFGDALLLTGESGITGLIGAVGNTINTAINVMATSEQAALSADIQRTNAFNEYSTGFTNLMRSVAQQEAALSVQGTIGSNTPPSTKYVSQAIICDEMYNFKVRKTTLSSTDRLRADRFFTAYGYNVNNSILNDPAQLHTRTRFTFVQADDFRITSYYNSTDLTRNADQQTVDYIKARFAAGLRIWLVTPNFDWSIANPIG